MNDLERHVIQQILTVEAADFSELTTQLSQLAVVSRHATGVGVYTNFSPTADLEPCHSCPSVMRLGQHVVAYIGAKESLGGFVLYVDDGIITTLEGYIYEGQWPDDALQHFRLH
ncbi:hypothetical protein LAJ19_20550 (plasmid) [Deinococcus taeanensis]|uniref:hypothetical protein n=1 Tax=Deinococcus taeanensis TaxID=2737050 RepID=UPI001CDC5F1F|nr:hypothetical protein [Deinococcus taeanensis]UBV43062.1 hypothetical protein LAJ19_02225 [Deinococcus taeanensis]UBV45201.1 hypothetical protein LAJ19_20550 [Deinococcus taeanensis]